MGSMNALGFAEAVEDGQVTLHHAITWHLQANHYPPVPTTMVEPCIEAIDAGNDEDWDRLIELPEPVTYRGASSAPAWALVEAHHLDSFIGEI